MCAAGVCENAHIVDQSRSELLFGLDDIDDVRNYVWLCCNHHQLFDDREFVFVPDGNGPNCEAVVVASPSKEKWTRPHDDVAEFCGRRITLTRRCRSCVRSSASSFSASLLRSISPAQRMAARRSVRAQF